MRRWIDADALITELEKDEFQFDKEAEEARNNPSAYTDGYADAMWSRANGIRDAMIEIYDAPSIDIVRCKECKFYDKPWLFEDKLKCGGYCNLDGNNRNSDDFCSLGERSEE